MKAVLQLSVYRRLLVAYALNELAWAVGSLALTVLVYRRTGSAVAAAGYFLCAQFVPSLFAPAIVGRLDHRPPRAVLPALYGIEVGTFAALAWIADHFSLAAVLALTVLDGMIALSARAIARTASADVLIPAGLLAEGNAVSNTAFSVCFMLGPALAGVTVTAVGTSTTLLIAGGLFALIAVNLLGSPGLPRPSAARTAHEGRVRAAIDYIRARPAVRSVVLLQAAAVLFFSISVPVEIVLAKRSLHTGDGGYGALLAAWGVGAVAGAAVYAAWRQLPARALIVAGSAALCGGFVVMAAAPTVVVAVIGAAVAGFGNGIESVAARTALQERVPDEWMGLTMGLNESILQAMPGGGIVIGGALAALAGARPALATAAGGALVITIAAWVALRPGVADRPGSPDRSGAGGLGDDPGVVHPSQPLT